MQIYAGYRLLLLFIKFKKILDLKYALGYMLMETNI